MSTETGNPTELCKRLRGRIDKPHIFLWINSYEGTSYPVSYAICNSMNTTAWGYCQKVNPGYYKTPGEAARSWHNYGCEL